MKRLILFLVFFGIGSALECTQTFVSTDTNDSKFQTMKAGCLNITIQIDASTSWTSSTTFNWSSKNASQTISLVNVGATQKSVFYFSLTNFAKVELKNLVFTTVVLSSTYSNVFIAGCQFTDYFSGQQDSGSFSASDTTFSPSGTDYAFQLKRYGESGDSHLDFIRFVRCNFDHSSPYNIEINHFTTSGIEIDSCNFTIINAYHAIEVFAANFLNVTDSTFSRTSRSVVRSSSRGEICASNCVAKYLFNRVDFELPSSYDSNYYLFNGTENAKYGYDSISFNSCTFTSTSQNVNLMSIGTDIPLFELNSCDFSDMFIRVDSKMDYTLFRMLENTGLNRIDLLNGEIISKDVSKNSFLCPMDADLRSFDQGCTSLSLPGVDFYFNPGPNLNETSLKNASLQIIYDKHPEYQGFIEWLSWAPFSTSGDKRAELERWVLNLNPPTLFSVNSFPYPQGFPDLSEEIQNALYDPSSWSAFGIQLDSGSTTSSTTTSATSQTSDSNIPSNPATDPRTIDTQPVSGTGNSLNPTPNNSFPVGGIIGIVIGAIVILVIVAFLIFFLLRRKSKTKEHDNIEISTRNPSVIQDNLIFLKNIVLEQQIGSGNFGDVYRATWNGTTTVAAKRIRDGGEQFLEEANLLMKLNHPNVVRMIGIWKSEKEEYFMILEFCKLGSVVSFLNGLERDLSHNQLLLMCQEVAAGMMYLESQKIIHRDLGARNLLVRQQEGNYIVQVSDFGLSRLSEDYYKSDSVTLPYKWSAPEMMTKNQSSTKSDVWSFGVCMWEIFTGGMIPYAGQSNKEVVDITMEKGCTLNKPKGCSEEVWDIMKMCWQMNPKERPSFQQLYQMIQKLTVSEDRSASVSEGAQKGIYFNSGEDYVFSENAAK